MKYNIGRGVIEQIASSLITANLGERGAPTYSRQYYPAPSPEVLERAKKNGAPCPEPLERAKKNSAPPTPGPDAARATIRGAELYQLYRQEKKRNKQQNKQQDKTQKSPWPAIRQEVCKLIPDYGALEPSEQDEVWETTRNTIHRYWARHYLKIKIGQFEKGTVQPPN
jgi:hypothetical protein